ncbi:MAG: polysaccharide biosynthesis protein, partial [Phycisphaerae bacterium]|nr:polysaccharide biosynthesis protein [Phycisphaerae bacterium]
STDKAVRPTNLMGATKRFAELIVQAAASKNPQMNVCMVRFGNVLGSSGSVVPTFKKQIRRGGPVEVTHREMTRYFMTIPEASQLVMQAGALANSGEVFVLDMGKPVKIYTLAERMIEQSGHSVRDDEHPHGDIEIEICGLRPGEKMYEELSTSGELETTTHPKIHQSVEQQVFADELVEAVNQLEKVLETGDEDEALRLLCLAVPEYKKKLDEHKLHPQEVTTVQQQINSEGTGIV